MYCRFELCINISIFLPPFTDMISAHIKTSLVEHWVRLQSVTQITVYCLNGSVFGIWSIWFCFLKLTRLCDNWIRKCILLTGSNVLQLKIIIFYDDIKNPESDQHFKINMGGNKKVKNNVFKIICLIASCSEKAVLLSLSSLNSSTCLYYFIFNVVLIHFMNYKAT